MASGWSPYDNPLGPKYGNQPLNTNNINQQSNNQSFNNNNINQQSFNNNYSNPTTNAFNTANIYNLPPPQQQINNNNNYLKNPTDKHPPISALNDINNRNVSRNSNLSANSNFLAEQYESDRKLIIDSCFSKPHHKTGKLPNSYITHVRIIENIKFPNSRALQPTKSEYKKNRILVLSSNPLNKNEIKLHKGRENANNTFQIGRTWELSELTSIEKDLIIDKGFLLKLSKIYYWETNSPKERQVFIKSIVNIFMQAYNNSIPILINWDLSLFNLNEKTYQRALQKNKNLNNLNNNSINNLSSPSSGHHQYQNLALPNTDFNKNSFNQSNNNTIIDDNNNTNVKRQIDQNLTGTDNSSTPLASLSPINKLSPSPIEDLQPSPIQKINEIRQTEPITKQNSIPERSKARNAKRTQNNTNQKDDVPKQNHHHIYKGINPSVLTNPDDPYSAISSPQAISSSISKPNLSLKTNHDVPYKLGKDSVPYSANIAVSNNKNFNIDNSRRKSLDHTANNSNDLFSKNISNIGRENVNLSPVQTSKIDPHNVNNNHNNNNNKLGSRDNDLALKDINEMLRPKIRTTENLDESREGSEGANTIGTSHSGMTIPDSRNDTPLSNLPTPTPYLSKDLSISKTRAKPQLSSENNFETTSVTSANISKDSTENELSFEKGDEVRYSAQYNEAFEHQYHQVTTIEEENLSQNLIDMDKKGQYEVTEKHEPENILLHDDVLNEVLDDLHWNPYDDIDELTEKLDTRIAEFQHEVNRSCIDLETSGDTLEAAQESVEAACAKLSPSFSLFLMEMGNVSEDIEFIEARGNGVQVESANKKALWNVLNELLQSVSLDEETLNELLNTSISERNLPNIEKQLALLVKAFKAIRGKSFNETENVGSINALTHRRKAYESVTRSFVKKVIADLDTKIDNLLVNVKSETQLAAVLPRLLRFASLTAFCKEVSPEEYGNFVIRWNHKIKTLYESLCENLVNNLDLTHSKSLHSSRNLNRSFNSDRFMEQWHNFKNGKQHSTKHLDYSSALKSIMSSFGSLENICIIYQNFADNFFHLTDSLGFSEYLEQRQNSHDMVTRLDVIKPLNTDREISIIETDFVSYVFQNIVNKISRYLSGSLEEYPTIAPSLILFFQQRSKFFESTSFEFILKTVIRYSQQIQHQWLNFTEEQGLDLQRDAASLSGNSIFLPILNLPIFIKDIMDHLRYTQHALQVPHLHEFPLYTTIESSFENLALSGYYALKPENKDIGLQGEDNQGNSRMVALIANSLWLSESFSFINQNETFSKMIVNFRRIFASQKRTYSETLLRETMPKLISFVIGASSIVESYSEYETQGSSRMAVYNQQNLNIILEGYNADEMKKIIKTIYLRVQHDFGSETGNEFTTLLSSQMWTCIQAQTVSFYLKLYTLIEKHYRGTQVNFSKNDIVSAFEEYKI